METTLRNVTANLEVAGVLSEKNLEITTDKNNRRVIKGYLVLKVGDLDFVTVNVYVGELTTKGDPNSAFTGMQTVMNEYKSIAEVGEVDATRLVCKKAQVQPNSYVGKEDLMVHENVRYSGSFFTRVNNVANFEPKAEIELEGYVQSIIEEYDLNSEPTGRLKVKLYVPTYRGVEPMEAIIDSTIASDFSDLVSLGQTVYLAGKLVNRNIITEQVIHMAMGGDRVKTSSKRTSEIVFNQADVYDLDDPKSLSDEAIRASLVERDLRLDSEKEKLTNEKKNVNGYGRQQSTMATGRTLPRFTANSQY